MLLSARVDYTHTYIHTFEYMDAGGCAYSGAEGRMEGPCAMQECHLAFASFIALMEMRRPRGWAGGWRTCAVSLCRIVRCVGEAMLHADG